MVLKDTPFPLYIVTTNNCHLNIGTTIKQNGDFRKFALLQWHEICKMSHFKDGSLRVEISKIKKCQSFFSSKQLLKKLKVRAIIFDFFLLIYQT